MDSALRDTSLKSITLPKATGVLVAYADTYFGRRVMRRLIQGSTNSSNDTDAPAIKKQYKFFACMWDKGEVPKKNEEGPSATEDQPAVDAFCIDDASFGESQGGVTGIENTGEKGTVDDDTCIFWRGDKLAMRQAIINADYIVMELRQARDVFDMMHVLTTIELPRPKRVVVVSSLMTWFATPPLSLEPLSDDMGNKNEDDGDGKWDEEEEDDEEGVGIDRENQELLALDRNEVEAILGPLESTNDNTNAAGDEELDGSPHEVEILTEDQYNRRIPHAKYYNWREAERVVAAANSDERHLYTCVIFSGLMYGDGEDVLKPFFTQVWKREDSGLPIYGDGTQIVPTVHVQDLVTFTQRLLEQPTPPTLRYVFGVDSGTVTWRQMVRAMNHAFGVEKTFHVSPGSFVLHRNVELFTINLRVDNRTMCDTMPEEEDWVSRSGFVHCIEKVAFEFVEAYNLQPIRIVILGPPLSGKTCVAEELARQHYQLPVFTMERVVEEYKAHITTLKERLEVLYRHVCDCEKSRRTAAKKRAFLRRSKKMNVDNGDGGGDDDEKEEVAEMVNTQPLLEETQHTIGEEAWSKGDKSKHLPGGNGDVEKSDAEFTLTSEEMHEVETLAEEWLQQCDRAAELRDTISAMERVLTMKARLQPTTASDVAGATNPKKRKESMKQKRLNKTSGKRAFGEDEDVVNEGQENAPFHDKALALMIRWRFACADCRNQGYVLDGFPETVAQARLVFGSEPVDMLETVEESPIISSAVAAGGGGGGGGTALPEVNSAPPTTEPCDEARLPDFVFVFEAAENFLRDRLTAMSNAFGKATGTSGKRLLRFEEALTQHRRQFVDVDYSLPNFFECSRTVAKSLSPGGRAPMVEFVKVDAEPLLLPPPPESAFAVQPPGKVVLLLRQYIGSPHNLGPTPQQQHAEEIRMRKLELEVEQQETRSILEQCEREKEEYIRESMERSLTANACRSIEMADLASLEERKAPLRLYLQRNILPLLSKGLVEVCKMRPENPVDFLAEWLIRHNPLDDTCFDL